jgi:hypothetical protein
VNDRELLELAAKAAGIAVVRSRLEDPLYMDMCVERSFQNKGQIAGPWNPLTDDGDALRLAVRLCMSVTNTTARTSVLARPEPEFGDWISITEPHGDDPCAATRRAIVRAAAEIGRTM